MKLELTDELTINYNGVKKARPANGLDNIHQKDATIKVIVEGDSSYHPKTIPVSRIIEINGKQFKGDKK